MPRLVGILIVSLLIAATLWLAINRLYQHDAFASKNARESLEVTEEQTAELMASRQKADMIVFAVIGAALAATAGALSSFRATMVRRAIGGLTGLVAGTVLGAMAGYLGNWFDTTINFPINPTYGLTYWFTRWAILLLPIAVAAGLAVMVAARGQQAGESISGALVGGVLAVVAYCVLSGTITPNENHIDILPGHRENRLLILALAFGLIPAAIAWSNQRTMLRKTSSEEVEEQAQKENEPSDRESTAADSTT